MRLAAQLRQAVGHPASFQRFGACPVRGLSFALPPIADIYAPDGLTNSRRFVTNRVTTNTVTRNIIELNSGDIRQYGSGGVVTPLYATGPAGSLTAVKVAYSTTAQVLSLYTSQPIPAGDYKLRAKVKMDTGQGAKDLRYGTVTPGYFTMTVQESSWTTLSLDFTSNGTTYATFSVLPSATATVPFNLLIDEVQLYSSADTIPLFSAETHGWHLKDTQASFDNAFAYSGNVLDNTAGQGSGIIVPPSFPTAKTFTELTALVAVKAINGSTGYALISEANTLLGTTSSTFQVGVVAAGTPAFLPLNAGTSVVNILGQGWHILGVRLKNANRQTYIHEIELNTSTAAFAGFSARLLSIGGAAQGVPFPGHIAQVAVWDSYLSNADYQAAVATMRARVVAAGETMGTFNNFLIAEGDSRTASASSYAYLVSANGEFTPNLFMRNFSVSGSGIANLNTRLTDVQRIAAQAQLYGRRAVIVCWIGVNDSGTITTNPTNYYNNSLKPIWAAYKATGAKLVVATELSSGGNSAFDTARATLNGLIRGNTSLYDALADIAGDSIMGVDQSQTVNPSYWIDSLHPNASGHLLLKPYFRTAIASVMA